MKNKLPIKLLRIQAKNLHCPYCGSTLKHIDAPIAYSDVQTQTFTCKCGLRWVATGMTVPPPKNTPPVSRFLKLWKEPK